MLRTWPLILLVAMAGDSVDLGRPPHPEGPRASLAESVKPLSPEKLPVQFTGLPGRD